MKNIQIVVDVSMSTKEMIGLVYVFLDQFLSHVQENKDDTQVSYQLTWFSGDTCETVSFPNGSFRTESLDRLMGAFKQLKIKKGKKTNAQMIQNALLQSMECACLDGDAKDQVLLYFTDYHLTSLVNVVKSAGISRAFLFVPKDQGAYYKFRIVNNENRAQKLMPMVVWDVNELEKKLSPEDMNCLMHYFIKRR